MSNYELTLVLKTKDKVTLPGRVSETEDWGVRDLAYPIGGQKQGYYLWQKLALLPDEIKDLNQSLKQNDKILRFLLVKGK